MWILNTVTFVICILMQIGLLAAIVHVFNFMVVAMAEAMQADTPSPTPFPTISGD